MHALGQSTASALGHYQTLDLSSRLETADPHMLVTILYQELGQCLAVAERSLDNGRRDILRRQIDRARSILIALEASLDFASGGALAVNLASVYRAMRRELDDPACAFANVRRGIDTLAQAWKAIAPSP